LITETEARAVVNMFLYPEECRINEGALNSLVKKGLAERGILKTGRCTEKGERVAMRQLVYLLSLRNLTIKERRRVVYSPD
jgi:hypothetical protein